MYSFASSKKGSGSSDTSKASAGAKLSPLPQNIFDLWQNYIEGIGGRKLQDFSLFLSGVVQITGITPAGYCEIWFLALQDKNIQPTLQSIQSTMYMESRQVWQI
jgi:hypothetical protein